MFIIATIAMIVVGLLESAMGALIVPIFDQAFTQGPGNRTPTLFGLQRIIPPSGLAAWRTIALLLIVFTILKGIAEYFSTFITSCRLQPSKNWPSLSSKVHRYLSRT